MSTRINKIINWDGKEYAHIIEDNPNQFCDLCVFSDLCQKVILKKLAFEESPMKICEELCSKENTNYAMFLESDVAKRYINRINNA